MDEVFVISRMIKVKVGVISWSRRLRLITLTETLIILHITKTKSNNCFIIHWTKQKKNSCLCFFTDSKQNKVSELDMITLRNHAPQLYTTWLPVTLTWLLYNLQLDDVIGADLKNSLYAFGQSEKRYWVQCIIIVINWFCIQFLRISDSIFYLSLWHIHDH